MRCGLDDDHFFEPYRQTKQLHDEQVHHQVLGGGYFAAHAMNTSERSDWIVRLVYTALTYLALEMTRCLLDSGGSN